MRITWYILRLHFGPFLFGTSVVVFLFLLQLIYKFANDLIGKGLSYGIIGEFIFYNLAWMLVLAAPMGVLVATLMAYGKLSGSNELTIIKSVGGSAFRAMLPAIVGGALVAFLLFLFNDRILPDANQKTYALQNDIKQLKPTFAIEPGRLTTLSGYSILAREVDRERNVLYDVTIYGQEANKLNVINSKEAKLSFNQDFSRLLMDLRHGEVQQLSRNRPAEFNRFTFVEYHVTVPTSGYNLVKSDPTSLGRTDRTLDIAGLRGRGDTALARSTQSEERIDSALADHFVLPATRPLQPRDTLSRREAATLALNELSALRAQLEAESSSRTAQLRTANQYWVEIHKKYAIPFACFVFVFVGAPLGIVVRKGNFGVSASIALGFFIIYWACLVAGEKMADRLILSPAVAMWMANGVIGIMGLYLTILVSRETVTFSFDFSWVRRLFRR